MVRVDPVVAIVLNSSDDVGMVLSNTSAGKSVIFKLGSSDEFLGKVKARKNIPFGHKIARYGKSTGEPLFKYGHPIGFASTDILPGDHVHTHNLQSLPPRKAANTTQVVTKNPSWLREVIFSCLEAVGVSAKAAEDMTDALTEAHLRGVETHGIRRLRPYIERIRIGGVDAKATPLIETRGNVFMIDGKNAVGHHVGVVAAEAVSEMAKTHGSGVALVRNSNHFGFAGYYATRIAANNEVGFVTSNGQVCVAPPGGLRSLFSNNPIAIAAPTGTDAYLEMDIATSVTSRAKIVQAAQRNEPIARGLALDANGKETHDPSAALLGSLLPMGGMKGFFFLLAMEALTGVLSGGNYANLVSSKEASPEAPEGLAHLFWATDLESTTGAKKFTDRLQDLIERLETLPLTPGKPPLRYPGWDRWKLRRHRLVEGIPIALREYDDLVSLAEELGVKTG